VSVVALGWLGVAVLTGSALVEFASVCVSVCRSVGRSVGQSLFESVKSLFESVFLSVCAKCTLCVPAALFPFPPFPSLPLRGCPPIVHRPSHRSQPSIMFVLCIHSGFRRVLLVSRVRRRRFVLRHLVCCARPCPTSANHRRNQRLRECGF